MDGISIFILILVMTEMQYSEAVYPREFTTSDATLSIVL